MTEDKPYPKPKKPTQYFNRKALNVIIIVTAVLILVFSQMGEWPNSNDENQSPADASQEKDNDITLNANSTPLKATKTVLETLSSVPKTPLSQGRDIDIQNWTNPKGAKVFFVAAPDLPMLDVRVIFDAGAARDDQLPGLAGLTSDMLLEGSANYNVDQIATHFEQLGAHISTSAHRDMAIVQLRTLTTDKYLNPALTVFAEIIAKPSFPSSSFARHRKLMLIGLEQEKQSPRSLISKRNFQHLYSNHPYGIPPNGTNESIRALTIEDLKHFHQRYYVAQNVVIALVGDITRQQAETIANQITQEILPGKHAPTIADVVVLDNPVVDHIEHPTQQTHILISTHGITRMDKSYMALYVGNEIFGGSGFSSILNEEIRQDRGLSYSVYSYFSAMRSQGPFTISLQTKTENVNEALKVVRENLTNFIDKGPTQEQLDTAIQNITSSFPLNTASNSSIVSYLGSIGFYSLPLDYLDTFTQKAARVSIDDIKTAFSQVIKPEKMVTITLGHKRKDG